MGEEARVVAGGGGASSKPHGAKPPTQRFPTLPYATHVQKQHNTRAQDRHNVGGGRGDAHIRRLVTDGHHVYAVPFHRSQAVMMPPTSPMAPMEPSLSPMPPAAVQWAANAPSPAMCTRRRARSRRAPVVQQGGGRGRHKRTHNRVCSSTHRHTRSQTAAHIHMRTTSRQANGCELSVQAQQGTSAKSRAQERCTHHGPSGRTMTQVWRTFPARLPAQHSTAKHSHVTPRTSQKQAALPVLTSQLEGHLPPTSGHLGRN